MEKPETKRLVYHGLEIGKAYKMNHEKGYNFWPDLTEYMRSVVLHLMPEEYYQVNGTHQALLIQEKFYEITGLTAQDIYACVNDKWDDVLYLEPKKAIAIPAAPAEQAVS